MNNYLAINPDHMNIVLRLRDDTKIGKDILSYLYFRKNEYTVPVIFNGEDIINYISDLIILKLRETGKDEISLSEWLRPSHDTVIKLKPYSKSVTGYISYIKNLEESVNILCPLCKTRLIITRYSRAESLNEQVTGSRVTVKPMFSCPNKECLGNTFSLYWTSDGDYYGSKVADPEEMKKLQFIDNNDAPFNTFQRQVNVEIYKHDEDFILLEIWRLKLKVVFSYKADECGNILKRRWKIETWIKRKDSIGYVQYLGFWRMFFYCLQEFRRYKKEYYNPNVVNKSLAIEGMKKNFIGPSWDKRPFRIASKIVLRIIHPFLYRKFCLKEESK